MSDKTLTELMKRTETFRKAFDALYEANKEFNSQDWDVLTYCAYYLRECEILDEKVEKLQVENAELKKRIKELERES